LREHKDIKLENFALSGERLKNIGVDISKSRNIFLEAAVNEAKSSGKANGASPKEIEEVVKKLRYRGSTR